MLSKLGITTAVDATNIPNGLLVLSSIEYLTFKVDDIYTSNLRK